MKLIKRILLGLIILAVVLIAVGLVLPRQVHVERSTVIDTPQTTVFTVVNGFKLFNEWSPWAEIDPDNTQYTFSGPDHGVGARMEWTSPNPEVGAGSQEIIASQPYDRVTIALDFGTRGTATSYYLLQPEGTGTKITWGFDSDVGYNLFMRYLGLIFDSLLGPDYEKGLASLKILAEGLPKANFSRLDTEIVAVEPIVIAYVSGESQPNGEAIAAALAEGFAKVQRFIAANDLQVTGAPIAITHEWNEEENRWVYDAALPVNNVGAEMPTDSEVKLGTTPSGRMLRVVQVGPYETAEQTYEQILAWLAAHGYEWAGSSFEQYMNDPANTPSDQLVTHIYVPIK